ncbi:hypothetical protein ACA910_012778 [Epithemia clementina (nom. ined.)]
MAPAGLSMQDYSCLAALEQALSHLTQSWPTALKAEMDKEVHAKFFAARMPFQTNFAHPIMQFLQSWSSNPSSLGNKLADTPLGRAYHRLQALETATQNLSTQVQNLGNPAMMDNTGGGGSIPNPFAWSSTGFAQPPPPTSHPVGPAGAGINLVALEESV